MEKEKFVWIIESKRQGGGSYSTVWVFKSEESANKKLEKIVEEYGDSESWLTTNDRIKVNMMGIVYYKKTKYRLED